jgi:4-amino-4-deoxy-L-arabinose transferase-like glycosyltransferase
MAFVYASFYLVQQHRPFTAANLQAVSDLVLDVLTAGAILAVGAGVGRRVCRWLQVPFTHPAEQIVLGTGVGLGALSMAVLGMGLLGWLQRWAMVLLLGGLALLVAPDLVAIVSAIREMLAGSHSDQSPPGPGESETAARGLPNPRSRSDHPDRTKPGLLGLYIGATFLLALPLALAPPADWDGLFYHLTLPRLYIESGRIAPLTDMPHQFFPSLMEMLYLAATLLRGDVAAKLLHYGYMLLLAGLLYLMARRHVGRDHGWPAVALYTAIPMVAVLGGWAYNDLALAFYQVAALYALLYWLRRDDLCESHDAQRGGPNPRLTAEWQPAVEPVGHRHDPGRAKASPPSLSWVVLAALCCGLAMGVKYTSLICPLVMVGLIVWHIAHARTSQTRGAELRALVLFGGVTLLVAAPWYARNLAFTGNPVYPFAYRLFDGAAWDAWRAAWYARAGSGLGVDPIAWFRLPWTLSLGLRDMNFYDGRMGPLFLLALPFLIAWSLRLYGRPGPRPQAVGMLMVYALAQYVVWTIGVVASQSLFQSRLLLPAFVALCVPCAYVYDELRTLDTTILSLRRLVGLSVALVLAANLCYQFLDTLRVRPLPVLVGEESREAYLARNLGAHYGAMELINERVPAEGRVLFLWEPRSYYCRRPAQPDAILDRWAWLLVRHKADLAAIAAELEQEGYTHLLLHRAGAEFVRREQDGAIPPAPLPRDGVHGDGDFAALDAFLQIYGRELGRVGEAYELYRLSRP